MWEQSVRRYAWADLGEADELQALTVSVVGGRTEDDVIRAFGGDPVAALRMTTAEALEVACQHYPSDYALLQTMHTGDRIVALESGSRGRVAEVARRASSFSGEFFSIHWDVEGYLQVMHAAGGQITGVLEDPSWIEDASFMDDAPEIPVWAEGAPFTLETAHSVSFALMERLTGVAFDPAWFNIPLRTVHLAPSESLFPDLDAAFRY
ncbi:hypothetical protein ABIA33_003975 [Streptacidiphilus sp. MAP12-16]|uniref:hypothetical protein n=1 Tax=Streptacidiphilus sp. MAP12-16 TaxID=3156300 RepID=UPI003518101F